MRNQKWYKISERELITLVEVAIPEFKTLATNTANVVKKRGDYLPPCSSLDQALDKEYEVYRP